MYVNRIGDKLTCTKSKKQESVELTFMFNMHVPTTSLGRTHRKHLHHNNLQREINVWIGRKWTRLKMEEGRFCPETVIIGTRTVESRLITFFFASIRKSIYIVNWRDMIKHTVLTMLLTIFFHGNLSRVALVSAHFGIPDRKKKETIAQ